MNMTVCIRCKQETTVDDFDLKGDGERKRACRTCCQILSREATANKKRRPKSAYGGSDYKSRSTNLRDLGFLSYQEYSRRSDGTVRAF
jgi:hypothetical protein